MRGDNTQKIHYDLPRLEYGVMRGHHEHTYQDHVYGWKSLYELGGRYPATFRASLETKEFRLVSHKQIYLEMSWRGMIQHERNWYEYLECSYKSEIEVWLEFWVWFTSICSCHIEFI